MSCKQWGLVVVDTFFPSLFPFSLVDFPMRKVFGYLKKKVGMFGRVVFHGVYLVDGLIP